MLGGVEKIGSKTLQWRLDEIIKQTKTSDKLIKELKHIITALTYYRNGIHPGEPREPSKQEIERYEREREEFERKFPNLPCPPIEETLVNEASEEFRYGCGITLGKTLELNIYNASTFACDDLLNLEKLEFPIKPKIKYVGTDVKLISKMDKA